MPVLQPVSDTASCGPRHVMLLLSLWASSQFLKQTLSTFRRAVRGSRRRGGAGRSAQLFRSSSPSFCVPLIQPRGEHRVTWYAARCEDFLQEPSFVSCLWERSAVDLFCWMERAAALLICFTTTHFFWSFATAEFSLGSCLPKHLERRFATLFL